MSHYALVFFILAGAAAAAALTGVTAAAAGRANDLFVLIRTTVLRTFTININRQRGQ